ncbi:hypothetical protein TREMEDRAFT_40713 [Tremella mesenterica DSM 1558]|uniref:uncharacterized protein n=1 Tax=Tremella mesenterica (strain ATCC 24925 / CBS 8224 / DSM 1558 / NBRC 9311 / NRRL Y-6157 / RJB 2259-6 / UBC 559-6) TaxID=578456 RepID=UPI0003F49393|nr:uncharacterized protein TREMEDRAFT_40713 [Tremella mesenterica DSM 1558]EIW67150.1 hypothetical protein TREMEDRAFT_40713 [Tremella mesenterica DSM 1558]
MPAPTENLSALITFTLPTSALDHDESIYLTFPPPSERPTETVRLSVTDLRPTLDGEQTPGEQLKEKGYAAARHKSEWVDELPKEDGTERYLEETAAAMKEWLGCSYVIAWNSVVRKNQVGMPQKLVPKQQGPEKGFVPTTRVQPVASVAHVDQNAQWGKELCGKAMGRSADEVKRAMIVNLWRPLHGPVTNAPLFVCPYPTLTPQDLGTHASQYGFGHDIHHSPSQQWAYIRHQMPDEVLLLKCYDTAQGEDGSALYCGHVAGQVGEQDWVDGEQGAARESVEVRCVAVWE